MTTTDQPSPSSNISPEGIPSQMRVRFGLVVTLFGLLIFLVGAHPALFGLDRSPVIGFVQISVFLVGLAIVCIGGYIGLMSFWRNGDRTIAADIGSRLVATGYVVAVFSGMADVFGFGTQVSPQVPIFGPWQATGVQLGEVLITIGFLLLIPIYRRKKTEEK
ncbi:MAG TPA: hypothetical protein VF352_04030 [Anaerolineales bacterium]